MRIQKWFNQSNEEASKYSDAQVDKLYWNLLAREFFALVKKFKVTGIIEPENNIEIKTSDMDNILEESNMIDNDDREEKIINDIQKAFDDYNNIVSQDYFLQFDEAKKEFIDESGRHPQFVACTNTWDLVFTFNTLKELKERLKEELEDYYLTEQNISNNNVLEESNMIDNDDREEKIKDIIDKLKILNELWWKSEEYHDNNALQKHNKLEQEIRKNMSDIGLDFDSIGAEYEDMISKLQKMIDNNVLEESNIIDNDKRNPKIIKENPDGSGQVEYTRYTSHEKVRRIINVTADEMNRIKEAISSGNEDNIDNIFYNIG